MKVQASASVVTVGKGRGFIVEGKLQQLFVITAAHCLPHLPPAHPASDATERTYPRLLASLGKEASVAAECLFADPVADVAVLGSPDNQALSDGAKAYGEMMERAIPLPIKAMSGPGSVWLLSLNGRWIKCDAETIGTDGPLWIHADTNTIKAGMSGSPVLADDGSAVGLISTGSNNKPSGPNPNLMGCLPGWLLRELSEAATDD